MKCERSFMIVGGGGGGGGGSPLRRYMGMTALCICPVWYGRGTRCFVSHHCPSSNLSQGM